MYSAQNIMFHPEHPHHQFDIPKVPNVLIVDDDIEAIAAIETIFHNLGCNTYFAQTIDEARKKICAGEADLIVMDWMLGTNVTAAELIEKSVRSIEKFHTRAFSQRAKVVTYSSLAKGEISFPENPYMNQVEHWQKPLGHLELTRKSVSLLNKIGR